MIDERLRDRLLAEIEEIRGKQDVTDLDKLRLHGGILLSMVDTDLLREIADLRDQLKAAFAPVSEDDDDLFSPPLNSPRNPRHPLHSGYRAYMDLQELIFTNDPYAINEVDDEIDPIGEWEG